MSNPTNDKQLEELRPFLDCISVGTSENVKLEVDLEKWQSLILANREQYAAEKEWLANLQMAADINMRFKEAMIKQSLSPQPPKGTRFRTPEEELALILAPYVKQNPNQGDKGE